MGFNPTGSGGAYSVRSVEDELVQGTMPYLRFRLSREKGALVVRNPSDVARRTIEQQSAKTGEAGFVSEADRDVVALAQLLRRSQLLQSSRSEEHTSELQSLTNLVCRLLLEKKKKQNII